MDLEVHEADHTMTIYGWFKHYWLDPRLKWNPDDHYQVSVLSIEGDKIWQPDLSVYNAAGARHTIPEAKVLALIYPTGKVLYVPPYHFEFICILDMTYWPNDVHTCSMKLGSWVHSEKLLDLTLEDFAFNVITPMKELARGNNISNTEWKIVDSTIIREVGYYPCCKEAYIDIKFTFIIERDAPAYCWTVKLPAACLSLLTLILFLLPPGAGEKIIFGGICLILDFLFINYTSNTAYHAPSHTPLIVQLVGQQVVLVLVSVFASSGILRMAKGPHSFGLPSLLKTPVMALSRILCLGNYVDVVTGPHNTFTESIKADEAELGTMEMHRKDFVSATEWVLLAAVADRLMFILYLAICIITLIRFHSVL
ncbi:Neuronal acetylcholine receptor subunit alpha-7 [Halocaridina rubra]|uniref:Neuronal acetylcholine receptor subunit alpha-7 n=1 Tax=Halocaridina rubra TaxID=373956 RepID=A0AAN9AH79_HALRR